MHSAISIIVRYISELDSYCYVTVCCALVDLLNLY